MKIKVGKKLVQYVVETDAGKISIKKQKGIIDGILDPNLTTTYTTLFCIKNINTNEIIKYNAVGYQNSFWDTTDISALEKLYRYFNDYVTTKQAQKLYVVLNSEKYWKNFAIKEAIKNKIFNMKNKKPKDHYPYHKRKAAMDKF